jgi:hypothetical protein
MKFEVNGELIETSFWFWVLTILIDLFTFWIWAACAFLVVTAFTILFNIQPSNSPLWTDIFVGCIIFGLLWGFMIGFGVSAAIERYL